MIAVALFLATTFGAAAPPAAPVRESAPADVRTIAGSGQAGITDGPAASASFLFPTAIARGADGTLFVADEAAQRIRAVTPGGSVVTIAGSGDVASDGLSVRGGFADGFALEAKFNRPNALAVGPDGTLYISDRRNACIRKLERGTVSTFAGKCSEPGTADGSAGAARIKDPRALALDASGVLYVADYGVGVRTVARNGDVATIHFRSSDDKRTWGLAIGGAPPDDTLVASTPSAVFVENLATHVDYVAGTDVGGEGRRPFGNAGQLAALGHREFLFSDIVSSTVRYMRLPAPPFVTTVFTRTIAGGPFERPIDNAGFHDGNRQDARFFVPHGLALANGAVLVADSGNRRIREVVLPHVRLSEAGLADRTPYDGAHYQIVYIGASWAYWDSLGDDSICGRLESELDASRAFGMPVRCHPVRIDAAPFAQIEDYLANYLSGRVDTVVVSVNLAEAFSLYPNSAPPSTADGVARFREHAAALQTRLAKAGTKLAFIWNEDADDVSDAENAFEREAGARLALPWDLADNYRLGTRLMIDAVAPLGIAQVDTYQPFIDSERSAQPPALYGTDDSHMTPRGSALMAHLLARELIATKGR
jgi:sugar lactone lactonase YvrE